MADAGFHGGHGSTYVSGSIFRGHREMELVVFTRDEGEGPTNHW
jgi:hypothetical protein